jgi:hypothetical protein
MASPNQGKTTASSHQDDEEKHLQGQEAQNTSRKEPRARGSGSVLRNALLVIVALGVVAGAVTAGVVLSKDDNSTSASPPTPATATDPDVETPSPATPPTASGGSATAPPVSADSIPWYDEFLGGLPPYSLEAAQNDEDSPQAKALAWLQRGSELEMYRLYQRYALAVLYFSTDGESWVDSTGWLSDAHECTWAVPNMEGCDWEGSRFVELWLTYNGLVGSMPKELSLLTSLRMMTLVDELSAFSVAIYPELYVRLSLVVRACGKPVFDSRLTVCLLVTASSSPTCNCWSSMGP